MQRETLESNSTPSDCTVLVVDTDVKVVHGFAQSLRRAGYLVFEATSFEDGKRLWYEIRPAALIVDVRLGQFNGLQLLMRARSDRPDVKAIITCPFSDPVLEAEARRFGGTFMIKPLAPWQVVGALQAATSSLAAVPATPPLLIERRRAERRQRDVATAWADRRLENRRAAPAADSERRAADRRQVVTPGFAPERRVADRRVVLPVERRMADRRQLVIPDFTPDRRTSDRRRVGV